jgi:hypothetical protein
MPPPGPPGIAGLCFWGSARAFLQLFAVVVRGGFLDSRLDLGNARMDVSLLLTGATDDSGALFGSCS